MTTSAELIPFNGGNPQFGNHYNVYNDQRYSQPKYQPWTPETTQVPFVSNPPPTNK